MLRKLAVLGACMAAALLEAQEPTPKNAVLGPGDHRIWLAVGELRRDYLLHVPAGYDGNRSIPLVLMFHGSGGSSDETASATGWRDKADSETFLAVFPNGFPNTAGMRVWNDGRPATDGRVDDVAFARALLDDLAARFRVDRQRIYVVGFSNGAGLAFRLGAELGDRIASIAPVAGALSVNTVALVRPVPMIFIIGTRDGGFRPGPRSASLRWAALLGCTPPPDSSHDGRFTFIEYQGCPRNVAAVAYYIDGWEHYWPGGKNRGIEMWAEKVIWTFFVKHPLHQEGKREKGKGKDQS
jgi:polyhydroxybutyrate depolymerase